QRDAEDCLGCVIQPQRTRRSQRRTTSIVVGFLRVLRVLCGSNAEQGFSSASSASSAVQSKRTMIGLRTTLATLGLAACGGGGTDPVQVTTKSCTEDPSQPRCVTVNPP